MKDALKKFVKIGAVLLCATVLSCSLASCNNGGNSSSSSPSESSSSPSSSSPSESSTPTDPSQPAVRTKYTLEAEHTNLNGKYGSGYSGSTTGTGMIMSDDSDNKTASNGYFVGWLYYNGAFLSFEFNSETAADDVTISFSLSAEKNDCVAEGDDIFVGVNYDEDTEEYETTYDFPLNIESYSEMSNKLKDFQTYVVSTNISIKKGYNSIELFINNNTQGKGATMKAAAPLVDCMYLETTAKITPISYNTEYTAD